MTDMSFALGNFLSPVNMSHHFVVVIDNATYNLGSWSKVTGLKVSWERCEYRVIDPGNQLWVLPGSSKYENIKLSRAACADSEIVKLWLAATTMNPAPTSGAIALVDWIGLPVVQWNMNQCYPVAWSIVDFDADQGKPAIETLELAHGGFLDDSFNLPP
jgi:phage tail-like protein